MIWRCIQLISKRDPSWFWFDVFGFGCCRCSAQRLGVYTRDRELSSEEWPRMATGDGNIESDYKEYSYRRMWLKLKFTVCNLSPRTWARRNLFSLKSQPVFGFPNFSLEKLTKTPGFSFSISDFQVIRVLHEAKRGRLQCNESLGELEKKTYLCWDKDILSIWYMHMHILSQKKSWF